MNRIICDICGSEYPENAERCPICSYARQGTEKIAVSSTEAVRTKVKGGRFSNKNVKKRLRAQEKAASGGEESPSKPLWITVVLLLIAIALVTGYIVMRFLGGQGAFTGTVPAQSTAPATSDPATQPPAVPCESLTVEEAVLELDAPGAQKQLSVKALPGDTTDAVLYASADPSVATVSDTGLVTAVGSGQTALTVSCGTVVETVTVVCRFPVETTVPVQPTETTAPRPIPEKLTLDVEDASLFAPGEVFTLSAEFSGLPISGSKVTWNTSDAGVATVENGVVTAVGKGTATITAEYKGKKAQCIVRCRFEDNSWKASATDVTLSVGESFPLTVTNNSGETADVSWSADTEGIVSVSGRAVTALAPGTVTLTASVDGVSVSCIVRVK
ncbi:MAG: Ig-like domain-containing protein [Oscillospiraceae bacterium]|nr:Ig-like domain-containing protein [Oscillospiraceae bacterium]